MNSCSATLNAKSQRLIAPNMQHVHIAEARNLPKIRYSALIIKLFFLFIPAHAQTGRRQLAAPERDQTDKAGSIRPAIALRSSTAAPGATCGHRQPPGEGSADCSAGHGSGTRQPPHRQIGASVATHKPLASSCGPVIHRPGYSRMDYPHERSNPETLVPDC